VDYNALISPTDGRAQLSTPTIICRSWHPTEDPDFEDDDEELEIELGLHARGWRMCQCYSRYEPDGEFGHIAEERLFAIPQADYERAVGLVQAGDLPAYEQCVSNAVAIAVSSACSRPGFVGRNLAAD